MADLANISAEVVRTFLAKGLTLGTAESLVGNTVYRPLDPLKCRLLGKTEEIGEGVYPRIIGTVRELDESFL